VLIDFEVEQHEDTFPAMPPGAALSETVEAPKVEDREPETARQS
jgi:hypothetical protein